MDNELSIMPYKLILWKGKLHVQWKPSILIYWAWPVVNIVLV